MTASEFPRKSLEYSLTYSFTSGGATQPIRGAKGDDFSVSKVIENHKNHRTRHECWGGVPKQEGRNDAQA